MPQVGEIRKGGEIGLYKGDKFIWYYCADCKEKRWVRYLQGNPVALRCHRCACQSPRDSQETRRKKSVSHLGKSKGEDLKRWMSERWTEEMRQDKRILTLTYWQDPMYIRKQKISRNMKPNKAERKLKVILDSLGFSYSFVGDLQVILGGRCPDFINVDGQKKLIELFGRHWHEMHGRSPEEEEKDRIEHFHKYGFETLIIWDNELSDIQKLREKLISFEEARHGSF